MSEKLQSLLEKYKNNLVIRSLIQLVPMGFGSAADLVLIETLEKIKVERAKTFFDELAKGNIIVDKDLLKSEDFLHKFFSTTKYALNTRRREKIKMFARLLKNSLICNDLKDIDEYEDYLRILDDLTYREIIALSILDKFSTFPRKENQNDLLWADSFWDEFEEKLANEIKIPKNQIADFMNKISRTGCYEIFVGSYLGYTGGKGKLTSTYFRLKKYIMEEDKNKK